MRVLKIVAFIAIIAFCAWALWSSVASTPTVIAAVPTPECSPQALPSSYYSLNNSLRAFDDALLLAVNLPREQVVQQVERLQELRRGVEQEQTPLCMQPFKASLLAYMNRVLELLVAFVSGATPDSVMRGLAETVELRAPIMDAIAALTGATVTPYPTARPLPEGTEEAGSSIPVTGAPGALALVTHAEGVNLREGPGVNYTFGVVVQSGSQLPVVGIDATRQWLQVQTEDLSGWVFLPLVELNVSPDTLPVVETP